MTETPTQPNRTGRSHANRTSSKSQPFSPSARHRCGPCPRETGAALSSLWRSSASVQLLTQTPRWSGNNPRRISHAGEPLLWPGRMPQEDPSAVVSFHGAEGLLGMRHPGGHGSSAEKARGSQCRETASACSRYPRKTLVRWFAYFREEFPRSAKWQRLRGRVIPSVENRRLPGSLLECFLDEAESAEGALVGCLRFL